MQQAAPGKQFIEAPTGGSGATCRSCAHCPWMAMNGLENILSALREGKDEVHVDEHAVVGHVFNPRRILFVLVINDWL